MKYKKSKILGGIAATAAAVATPLLIMGATNTTTNDISTTSDGPSIKVMLNESFTGHYMHEGETTPQQIGVDITLDNFYVDSFDFSITTTDNFGQLNYMLAVPPGSPADTPPEATVKGYDASFMHALDTGQTDPTTGRPIYSYTPMAEGVDYSITNPDVNGTSIETTWSGTFNSITEINKFNIMLNANYKDVNAPTDHTIDLVKLDFPDKNPSTGMSNGMITIITIISVLSAVTIGWTGTKLYTRRRKY